MASKEKESKIWHKRLYSGIVQAPGHHFGDCMLPLSIIIIIAITIIKGASQKETLTKIIKIVPFCFATSVKKKASMDNVTGEQSRGLNLKLLFQK